MDVGHRRGSRNRTLRTTLGFGALVLGLALAGIGTACGAQSAWSPQRNVEIVVGSAPGGSNDRTARQMEKIIVEQKLLPTSLTVVNRPGAGGIMALTYVTQHAGEPHYLLIYPSSMLAAHITGQSKLNYTDFIPIAERIFAVFGDADCHTAFCVTGNEFIARGVLGDAEDKYLSFVDPDAGFVQSLGLTHLPALVHLRQDTTLVASAEGWDPEEWQRVVKEIAKAMALLDAGTITADEYTAIKAKALA